MNISDVWPIDRTVRVRIESGAIRNSSMERFASYYARKYVKLHLRIPFDPIRGEPSSISARQPSAFQEYGSLHRGKQSGSTL